MSLSRTIASFGRALTAGAALAALPLAAADAQQKRPNIVMLMTDDTGWNDFGAYSNGGKALGHPTPNVDKIAEEGATFTNWYGQASCTAGRASFITGRHSDPLGALDRRRSKRSEFPAQGDADDRRVLQEERLFDLFLRQVAPRRQARILSDRAWLRRDEELRRLLRRRLHLRLHQQVVPSLFPVVQSSIPEILQRKRELERVGGRGRPAGQRPRQDHLRALRRLSTKTRPPMRSNTSSNTPKTTSRSSWT